MSAVEQALQPGTLKEAEGESSRRVFQRAP